MKRIAAIAIVLLLSFPGCRDKRDGDNSDRFSALVDSMTGSFSQIKAEDYFGGFVPALSDNMYFVYVLNASCSLCIATALNCYTGYLKTEDPSPFYFLSLSKDLGVFEYYLSKDFKTTPKVYVYWEEKELAEGLYIIKKGSISYFTVW